MVRLSPITNSFGRSDLNVVNIIFIPDRFKQGIGKTKGQNILHRFFAEVMIDAEDLLFCKDVGQQFIHLAGAFQVVAKWLFNNNAGSFYI